MTKLVGMEPTESIYEEIITSDIRRNLDKKRLDRSRSCPSSRKTSRDMGRHYSASNLRDCKDNEDNLYAVVQGDDLEFMKLKDLLEEGENKTGRLLNRKDSARGTAQSLDGGDDRDLGETDSGCDCSVTGKETISTIHFPRPNSLDLKLSDTVYSEILHASPTTQIDFARGRITRESDNPLLRQEVIPSNSGSPATSMPSSRSGSIRLRRNDDGSTRSGSGDSGIQEDMQGQSMYANCTRRDRKLRRSLSSPQFQQFYANTSSVQTTEDSVYANMDEHENSTGANESTDSVYANMDDEPARPRTASRPIAIQSNQRKSPGQTEMIYSDLDFEEEPIPEYLSSSPGDASSTSSGFSSFTNHLTNTFTPPPLPNRPASVCARRRQTSFSSVSMSSFAGASSLKANFIGTHSAHKTSRECIDHAVKEAVHKTNLLDVKSVCVEINSSVVKFLNLTSPYHCILQFPIDEIHLMGQFSKDQRFMGFIVSQPGREALCYVFQSDQTSDIMEVIKDTFRENPWKQRFSSPDRPASIYGLPEIYRPTSFPVVVKIGTLKVKKSYLVINDSIRALLEKINPKEYRVVDLQIKESCVIVTNSGSREHFEQHSIPWILSLGLYSEDGRYFGYIVSSTKNGKTKMLCHVYKCKKVMMSASILEGIRSACQSALTQNQVPRYSNSMPRDAFRSKLVTSPDAMSRSSTSSDETTRDIDSPAIARTASVSSRISVSTLKLKNESNYSNVIKSKVAEIDPSETEQNDDATLKDEAIEQSKEPENIVEIEKDSQVEGHDSQYYGEPEDIKDSDEVDPKAHHKDKKSPFLKSKSKMLRNTLLRKKRDSKLSRSMQSLDFSPKEEEELAVPFEREEHKFVISYLCSAVVKPPLKSKHIEKCLKQYQKEVGKKQKAGEACCLGNKLQLEIVTDEGITMADVRNPNAFRRHFPISTVDCFIVHPENPDCFAFSTTVPGDEQHKYHLFYKARESIATVKDAFERLKLMQRIL